MPSSEGAVASAAVSSYYRWEDGRTVDADGKLVIPLIDMNLLSSGDPAERAEFERLLRYAVTDVGFLLLRNMPGLDQAFINKLLEQCHLFFGQPESEKDKLHMSNSKFFRGWTKLGDERTQYHQNLRENVDLGFELEPTTDPDAVQWRQCFRGPNQWPDEEKFPEFRETMLQYIDRAYKAQMTLIRLMLRLFDLPENYLDRYFTFHEDPADPEPFCLCKVAYYPKVDLESDDIKALPDLLDKDGFLQGCGPHKDNNTLLTILVQDDEGLEVQAHDGSWIKVPNLPDTAVVNIGLPLEEMSHGALAATVHRVNSRSVKNDRGRISVPFFLLPSLDLELEPVPVEKIPAELRRYVGQADSIKTDVIVGWNGSVKNRADRWIENRIRQFPFMAKHWPALWQAYKYNF
ncbi:hypothetical protein DFJ74DRAFT_120332 [Hyaloraphidium curvatum]|nr:hypothetical protein DFJ74DRAFT_120332 [Hyaloraphidium curvatum]